MSDVLIKVGAFTIIILLAASVFGIGYGLAQLFIALHKIDKRRAAAKRHKSRPVALVVRRMWDINTHITTMERSWYFDEPESDTVDPVTGERLLNGWSSKELAEIASRRSEWGL